MIESSTRPGLCRPTGGAPYRVVLILLATFATGITASGQRTVLPERLEIRALVPDPSRGTGFWFVTVSRARADGLGGFTGGLIRERVRSSVRDGALNGLRMTKEMLEGSPAP